MIKPDDAFLPIGKIVGLYGVRGWVKVFSYTQPRENILGFRPWYVKREGRWQALEDIEGRRHGKGVIARFFRR